MLTLTKRVMLATIVAYLRLCRSRDDIRRASCAVLGIVSAGLLSFSAAFAAPPPSVQKTKLGGSGQGVEKVTLVYNFPIRAYQLLGFDVPPQVPTWAAGGVRKWDDLMAVVARVERTHAALNRFKAEALISTDRGLMPLPPPLTLDQAHPDDPLIRRTPIDGILPLSWRLLASFPQDEEFAGGGLVSAEGSSLGHRNVDPALLRRLGKLSEGEPIILAHYAPDGTRAGIYLVFQDGRWHGATTSLWGRTVKRFDRHYYWFTGGLSQGSHSMPDADLAAVDGIADANTTIGADAIARALENAAKEKKP